MIDKVLEWTITISIGALGICMVAICIGILIAMFRGLFGKGE